MWEVTELDIQRRLVFVKPVLGKMEVSWPGDYGEIHVKILERMKKVLMEDTVYPYLMPNAKKRLDDARRLARSTGMLTSPIIPLGGYSYCIFPWLGTQSFRAYRRMLGRVANIFGISEVEFEGCYYISFRMEKGTPESLMRKLGSIAASSVDAHSLMKAGETPVSEKFDEFIPSELLRSSYASDKLDAETAKKRILEQMRSLKNI